MRGLAQPVADGHRFLRAAPYETGDDRDEPRHRSDRIDNDLPRQADRSRLAFQLEADRIRAVGNEAPVVVPAVPIKGDRTVPDPTSVGKDSHTVSIRVEQLNGEGVGLSNTQRDFCATLSAGADWGKERVNVRRLNRHFLKLQLLGSGERNRDRREHGEDESGRPDPGHLAILGTGTRSRPGEPPAHACDLTP